MTNKNNYAFLSGRERTRLRARLWIAAWMGLIDSPEPEAVEERRTRKNEEIKERLAKGEIVYGLTRYTPAMYLEYELTRFKLEYTVFQRKCAGAGPAGDGCLSRQSADCGLSFALPYREVTEEEKRAFYEENRELFTRYFGDSFAYDEVEMIIEKRLLEQEYENRVEELSARLETGGEEV